MMRPACALAAALCTYGLEQWAQSQSTLFVQHPTLSNFVMAGIVGLGLFGQVLRTGRIGRNYPSLGWLILGLFAYAAASLFWTMSPESLPQWAKSWPYILVFLVLSPLLITDERDLRQALMATLVLSTVILALLLTTAEWQGRRVVLQQLATFARTNRGGSPLAMASLAAYAAIIATLMNFQGLTRVWQILRWGVVAMGIFVCFQSGSRGQTLATFGVLVCFLPASRQIKNLRGFVGVVISLGLLLLIAMWGFDQIAEKSEARWGVDRMMSSYEHGRFKPAMLVLTYWAESGLLRWLFGLGSAASFDPNVYGFYPHLVIAEVLGELGLIGLGLFVTIVVWTGILVVRTTRLTGNDPTLRGLAATIGGLCLFEFMLSFKQGSMIGGLNMFAFAILAGTLYTALSRKAWETQAWQEGTALFDEQQFYAGGYADGRYGYAPDGA